MYLRPLILLSLSIYLHSIFICSVVAQGVAIECLTIKDGLPQNTVHSIVKDRYGYMWFGTWNGLCRYDGYHFKIYQNIFRDSTSLANNRVHYIYKDQDGILWISTFGSFVCRYNYSTDNFTRFKVSELPENLVDSTNRLRNMQAIDANKMLLEKVIGKFVLSPSREHVIFNSDATKPFALNDDNVYCVYKDDNDILWIGTAHGGVNKIDLTEQPFKLNDGLLDNPDFKDAPVVSIWADSSATWLGTQTSGIIKINKTASQIDTLPENDINKTVKTIYQDSRGDMWIGCRVGLLKYDRNKKLKSYFPVDFDNEQETKFSAIAEDPTDRSIWFGTLSEVLRYDRKSDSFQSQPLEPYFSNSSAVCLFFDSKNNLWIGTEYSGLICVRRNSSQEGESDTVCYRADGENPKLPDQRVYTITEDEFGTIWAGTANGLCRIDQESDSVKIFTKNDGLADQYIAKVLPDRRGNIWFSHKRGISKLELKTGVIRNYAIRGSVRGLEFMDGSGCYDESTETIYFGHTEGYISFLPKEIKDNPYLPKVVLAELQVLNNRVEIGQKVNGHIILTQPIGLTEKITLTHNDYSFMLEFAALNYSEPSKNRFAYKLEGVDKDWVYTNAERRIAAYSNLRGGNYMFKVKASNADGRWTQDPTILEIEILPPWWKTQRAYVFYVLLVLLVFMAVYKVFRVRQIFKQQLLKAKFEAEKNKELEQLKSTFFTNVSHEFRTPLTLIIDPLESLLSGNISFEKAKAYFPMMHKNAQRLLTLINQLLAFRKLESEERALKFTEADLVPFIRNIIASFEFRAEQQNIQLSFEPEREQLTFVFDPDIVDKVLCNLLSNAFKYTERGGKITIVLLSKNDDAKAIELSVSDTGIGIPAAEIDKIFEPFYRAKTNENSELTGSGIGLAYMRELVMFHHGEICVKSEPNKETRFTVTLPNLSTQFPVQLQPSDKQRNSIAKSKNKDLPPNERAIKEDMPIALIIEDNKDIREYLRTNLTPEYKVFEAENGNDGLKLAVESIPDIIISDIMMPGMNGLELCHNLKTDERTSHIPIVLLTARETEEYKIEGYATGADEYIVKPFSTALLLARIRNLIESRERLRQLFNKDNKFDTALLVTNKADKAFMDKLAEMIRQKMADPGFSVESAAETLCLSRTQLYRKVKALTGQSVTEFAATIRLNKACELLLEGEFSVADIAFKVGYPEPASFSRAFKKQFGQPPKKYSQENKGTNPA